MMRFAVGGECTVQCLVIPVYEVRWNEMKNNRQSVNYRRARRRKRHYNRTTSAPYHYAWFTSLPVGARGHVT